MAKKNDLARGISKFRQKIDKMLSASNRDQLAQFFAEDAAAMIKIRTRHGYGVPADGQPARRLAKLSSDYIEHRKRNRRELSSETSPGMSNLTYSGQMLDSLYARRRTVGNWSVNLKPQRDDGRRTNNQVARYVSVRRPFLFLSASELSNLGIRHRKRFSTLVKKSIR
jgi:hypothetical protein